MPAVQDNSTSTEPGLGSSSRVLDQLGRPLRDLRISVTDRCNFRCTYCMPRAIFGPEHTFLSGENVLSFDEIVRLTRLFAVAGVRKIRLTGGEPLLRAGLPELIERLTNIPGISDVALTTNGSALEKLAPSLKAAGLKRLTVSLDALDPQIFQTLSDTQTSVQTVLAGIQSAGESGFNPIKINAVLKRGINENQILPLAERFAKPGFVLRFIEYMDVGNTNGWLLNQVFSAEEILRCLSALGPIESIAPNYSGETARRYRFQGTENEFGIIASVTAPFCANCTRARISASGKLHTCLFSDAGLDLKGLLRSGSSDEQLQLLIQSAWGNRSDRYSEIRASGAAHPNKPEMSLLGG